MATPTFSASRGAISICMTKTQNLNFLKTDIEITPLEAPNVGVAIFQKSLLYFSTHPTAEVCGQLTGQER